MKKFLSSAFNWLKHYWYLLLIVLGGLISVLVFFRKKEDYLNVKPKNDLTDDKVGISRLEGRNEAVKEEIEDLTEDIKELDKGLEDSDELIVEAREAVPKMDSTKKLKKFDDLGY